MTVLSFLMSFYVLGVALSLGLCYVACKVHKKKRDITMLTMALIPGFNWLFASGAAIACFTGLISGPFLRLWVEE
jgi:hypothetical protein